MLAMRPTLVTCDSLLRSRAGVGLLPMEPGPVEAVVGRWRGAGGGIAPLVLGLGGFPASRCLATVELAIFRAACGV